MSGAGCQEKKVWVGQDEYSTIGRIKVCCLNCSRHCPVDNDGHLSHVCFVIVSACMETAQGGRRQST